MESKGGGGIMGQSLLQEGEKNGENHDNENDSAK